MKIFAILAVFLFSTQAICADEIASECRLQLKELCHDSDLVACHKKNEKNEIFLNCLGVLLPEMDAPKQVQEMQADHLFGSDMSSCFQLINNLCGDMETQKCVEEKGDQFSTKCRELIGEIDEQRNKMKGMGGKCFSRIFLDCEKKVEIPFSSYNLFVEGVRQHQVCIKEAMVSDVSCVGPIQKIIDDKAAAAAAAKAEAEKKAAESKEVKK